MRKPIIAGNWKMFKTTAEVRAFAKAFRLPLKEPSEAPAKALSKTCD